jgi:hypothetical protein
MNTVSKHDVLLLLIFVSVILSSIIFLVCDGTESGNKNTKLYIVYIGSLPKRASYFPAYAYHYLSMLQQVIDGDDVKNRLVQVTRGVLTVLLPYSMINKGKNFSV